MMLSVGGEELGEIVESRALEISLAEFFAPFG
jgi:hypothetical protein